jgi:hypothetical protein
MNRTELLNVVSGLMIVFELLCGSNYKLLIFSGYACKEKTFVLHSCIP